MDRRGERGFVLVVVLGVLAILTVVALGFAHRAVLDRRAAALTLDHAQALMLARGAVQRGIVQLRNQSAALVTVPPGAAKNPGPVWRQHPNLVEEGLVQLDADGTGDTVDYAIEDLESRISLNSAPEELLEEIDFLDLGTMTAILKRREVEPGEPPIPSWWSRTSGVGRLR
jgi:type II secretory pathway component PulK